MWYRGRVANPRPVATVKTGRVRMRPWLVARRDRVVQCIAERWLLFPLHAASSRRFIVVRCRRDVDDRGLVAVLRPFARRRSRDHDGSRVRWRHQRRRDTAAGERRDVIDGVSLRQRRDGRWRDASVEIADVDNSAWRRRATRLLDVVRTS